MAINQIKLDSAEKKGDKNAKRTNKLRKRIYDYKLDLKICRDCKM